MRMGEFYVCVENRVKVNLFVLLKICVFVIRWSGSFLFYSEDGEVVFCCFGCCCVVLIFVG